MSNTVSPFSRAWCQLQLLGSPVAVGERESAAIMCVCVCVCVKEE